METDELTQEAFDKLRERVQVLEELIFVEMKLTAVGRRESHLGNCARKRRMPGFRSMQNGKKLNPRNFMRNLLGCKKP